MAFVVISQYIGIGSAHEHNIKDVSIFQNEEDALKEFEIKKQEIIDDYQYEDTDPDDIIDDKDLYRFYISNGEDGWVQVSMHKCDLT